MQILNNNHNNDNNQNASSCDNFQNYSKCSNVDSINPSIKKDVESIWSLLQTLIFKNEHGSRVPTHDTVSPWCDGAVPKISSTTPRQRRVLLIPGIAITMPNACKTTSVYAPGPRAWTQSSPLFFLEGLSQRSEAPPTGPGTAMEPVDLTHAPPDGQAEVHGSAPGPQKIFRRMFRIEVWSSYLA